MSIKTNYTKGKKEQMIYMRIVSIGCDDTDRTINDVISVVLPT